MSRDHIEPVIAEYFRERPDVCAVYLKIPRFASRSR